MTNCGRGVTHTLTRVCGISISGLRNDSDDSVEMRLLRTCCVCQCRSGSRSPRHHRKRRKRRKSGGGGRHGGGGGSSDRESVSGSETGGVVGGAVVAAASAAAQHRAEAVDQQRTSGGGSRRSGGGSKRRQRATYRYEVVYRREEFSHDYLDHPEIDEEEEQVQNRHHQQLPVFRPVPEGQPTDSQPLQQQQQQQQPSAVVPFQSADYSLLSNYGRLEDFHPPALHSAVHSWEQQQRQPPQQQHSSYNDQPLYQNFGGT